MTKQIHTTNSNLTRSRSKDMSNAMHAEGGMATANAHCDGDGSFCLFVWGEGGVAYTYIYIYIYVYKKHIHNAPIHCDKQAHTMIHTHIHTYVHTCMHTHIHAYMRTCVRMRRLRWFGKSARLTSCLSWVPLRRGSSIWFLSNNGPAYTTHARMLARMCTCMHFNMHACMHIFILQISYYHQIILIDMHACVYACMYARVHACTHT